MKASLFNKNDFMMCKKDKSKIIDDFLKENGYDFLGLKEVFIDEDMIEKK